MTSPEAPADDHNGDDGGDADGDTKPNGERFVDAG